MRALGSTASRCGPPAQERHGLVEMGPEKVVKTILGGLEHLTYEDLLELGFQPGEEKALGRPYNSTREMERDVLQEHGVIGQEEISNLNKSS